MSEPTASLTRSLGFGFDRTEGKDEWLTPPSIVQALGPFDLDPCSPINRPWPTAAEHYTVNDNGLALPWAGRVWLNPPYGSMTEAWMMRLAEHGNGIALIFARTETGTFFRAVWDHADAILFIRGRLSFYDVTGKQGGTAGAPSVLIAYGSDNVDALRRSKIVGRVVDLKAPS